MSATREVHTVMAAGDANGIVFGCVVSAYVCEGRIAALVARFGASHHDATRLNREQRGRE